MEPMAKRKNPAAVALGRKGGKAQMRTGTQYLRADTGTARRPATLTPPPISTK
jgi:hypothetical protein